MKKSNHTKARRAMDAAAPISISAVALLFLPLPAGLVVCAAMAAFAYSLLRGEHTIGMIDGTTQAQVDAEAMADRVLGDAMRKEAERRHDFFDRMGRDVAEMKASAMWRRHGQMFAYAHSMSIASDASSSAEANDDSMACEYLDEVVAAIDEAQAAICACDEPECNGTYEWHNNEQFNRATQAQNQRAEEPTQGES